MKFFKVVFKLIFHSLHIFSLTDFIAVEGKISLDITIGFTSSMLTRRSLIRTLIRYYLFLNVLRTLNVLTFFTHIFVWWRSHHFLGKCLSLIDLILIYLLLVLLENLIITFYLLLIWNNILSLVSTLLLLMIIILMMLGCHFDISKNIIKWNDDQI